MFMGVLLYAYMKEKYKEIDCMTPIVHKKLLASTVQHVDLTSKILMKRCLDLEATRFATTTSPLELYSSRIRLPKT